MIYVVMGPTCSGKTEVANAIMDKLGCEAINFDAFQILLIKFQVDLIFSSSNLISVPGATSVAR